VLDPHLRSIIHLDLDSRVAALLRVKQMMAP